MSYLILVCTVCHCLSVKKSQVLSLSAHSYCMRFIELRNTIFVECTIWYTLLSFEPRHEITWFCICKNSKNKGADQLHGNLAADQCLCFRLIDSTILLLPISEISSLQSSSVAVQPSLCRTWSETPKTGFLMTDHI